MVLELGVWQTFLTTRKVNRRESARRNSRLEIEEERQRLLETEEKA
jgi:hypothetical protein